MKKKQQQNKNKTRAQRMKHSLVRHNQLFTLFLVSKKRASNKNEIVIDVQTVYEINDIRTAEMKSYEE